MESNEAHLELWLGAGLRQKGCGLGVDLLSHPYIMQPRLLGLGAGSRSASQLGVMVSITTRVVDGVELGNKLARCLPHPLLVRPAGLRIELGLGLGLGLGAGLLERRWSCFGLCVCHGGVITLRGMLG